MLAEQRLRRGDEEAARADAQAVVALAEEVSGSQPLAAAYKTLFEIAQRNGDAAEALSFYKSYAQADKAWLNEIKVREMAYQIVQQEAMQQSQQIELLHKDTEVRSEERRVGKECVRTFSSG